jgi:hypothetical protein
MPVAVEDAGEAISGEDRPARILVTGVGIRRNDRLVEDLAAGEVGVQVDVGGQEEVLVVVAGSLAEGDQIGGRGDPVGIVRRAAAAAVLGPRGKGEKADGDQQRDCPPGP